MKVDAAACLFAEQLAVGEAGPSAACRGGLISDLESMSAVASS